MGMINGAWSQPISIRVSLPQDESEIESPKPKQFLAIVSSAVGDVVPSDILPRLSLRRRSFFPHLSLRRSFHLFPYDFRVFDRINKVDVIPRERIFSAPIRNPSKVARRDSPPELRFRQTSFR